MVMPAGLITLSVWLRWLPSSGRPCWPAMLPSRLPVALAASVLAALPADGVAVFPAGDVYTALWQELQPLDLDATQSVQVLSSQADEGYFGGGQQNGRYQFKGRELDVSYSGGWEEGDRPSPAPMLLSSRGWGMLRNTWSDGNSGVGQQL